MGRYGESGTRGRDGKFTLRCQKHLTSPPLFRMTRIPDNRGLPLVNYPAIHIYFAEGPCTTKLAVGSLAWRFCSSNERRHIVLCVGAGLQPKVSPVAGLIPKQLMGAGKIKFEHLGKTKDLAGTSRETRTGTPHS